MQEMTQEEAALYTNVYVPAFIEKCAERGIQFPDEETLDQALESVAHIKSSMLAQNGNEVKQANAAIRQAVGLPERAVEAKAATAKKAALNLAQVPALKQAALSILRKQGTGQ